jgi:primosomal replication protein N
MTTQTETKVGTSSTGVIHRAVSIGSGIRVVAYATCHTSRSTYGGLLLRNVHSMNEDDKNTCSRCFVKK